MEKDYFKNPKRFPKNVDGPFYTTGIQDRPFQQPDAPLKWVGDCLACGAPEAAAPELLSSMSHEDSDTYFICQPNC